MRLLILLCMIFLTACGGTTIEYVEVRPKIPAETLTPCPISDRKARTVNALAVLATEHLRAAECANGKLEAVAQILEPL
jgi:hypothetical protein